MFSDASFRNPVNSIWDSGGSVMDVLNVGGNVADFSFTAANSQANVAVNILGEPLR